MSTSRRPPSLPAALEESLRAKEPDARGLRRLTGFDWAAKFMQLGVAAREVPQRYWHRHTEEGASHAVVSCHCGHDLNVELGAYPQSCDCERWFFYDGTRVWALASNKGSGVN